MPTIALTQSGPSFGAGRNRSVAPAAFFFRLTLLSVAVLGQSAPIVGRLPAGHRLNGAALDVRMDGPHLPNFEPEPQQVPPAVLLGIAVVEAVRACRIV
jgi:hypothetical protein